VREERLRGVGSGYGEAERRGGGRVDHHVVTLDPGREPARVVGVAGEDPDAETREGAGACPARGGGHAKSLGEQHPQHGLAQVPRRAEDQHRRPSCHPVAFATRISSPTAS
jgi:hypothetical protein